MPAANCRPLLAHRGCATDIEGQGRLYSSAESELPAVVPFRPDGSEQTSPGFPQSCRFHISHSVVAPGHKKPSRGAGPASGRASCQLPTTSFRCWCRNSRLPTWSLVTRHPFLKSGIDTHLPEQARNRGLDWKLEREQPQSLPSCYVSHLAADALLFPESLGFPRYSQ